MSSPAVLVPGVESPPTFPVAEKIPAMLPQDVAFVATKELQKLFGSHEVEGHVAPNGHLAVSAALNLSSNGSTIDLWGYDECAPRDPTTLAKMTRLLKEHDFPGRIEALAGRAVFLEDEKDPLALLPEDILALHIGANDLWNGQCDWNDPFASFRKDIVQRMMRGEPVDPVAECANFILGNAEIEGEGFRAYGAHIRSRFRVLWEQKLGLPVNDEKPHPRLVLILLPPWMRMPPFDTFPRETLERMYTVLRASYQRNVAAAFRDMGGLLPPWVHVVVPPIDDDNLPALCDDDKVHLNRRGGAFLAKWLVAEVMAKL